MINCEFDFAIFAKRQTNIFQDDASACIKCTLKDVQKIKKERKCHQKQNSWKISLCKYFHMEIFPCRKFPPGNNSIILLLLNFLSFILIFIEKKYHYLMCSFLMSKLLWIFSHYIPTIYPFFVCFAHTYQWLPIVYVVNDHIKTKSING